MNETYIFGAGFSKEINNLYPILSELTDQVLTMFQAKYSDSPILKHYNSLPNECKTDIEKLLSFLSVNWPWKTEINKYLDLALYKAIEDLLVIVISNVKNENIDEEYIEFIKQISYEKCNIITLNYDTLLEEISGKNNQEKSYEYCGFEIYFEDKNDKNKILKEDENIIKLQIPTKVISGRVVNEQIRVRRSFYEDTEAEIINNEFEKLIGHKWNNTPPKNEYDYKIKKTFNSFRVPKIIKLHGSIENEYSTNSSGKIIPPTLDKSVYYSNEQIRLLWTQALDQLSSSNKIIIVGFSFPQTDLSMIYLLQTAIQNNNDLEIQVINIENKDKVLEKYKMMINDINNKINVDYCGINYPLKKYIQDNIYCDE